MSPPFQPDTLMLLAVAVPFTAAALIPLFHSWPNLRELVTLSAAAALALAVWSLAGPVLDGARPERDVLEIVPGFVLALAIEPLGMLFALVAGSLWLVNSIYSIGYMRANGEPRQTSYYVCFAVALGATTGIAFAKNLVTLFLFYEVLTLSTYPLVVHKGSEEAKRAGRVYLTLLLGTSMVLLLPAILGTWLLAGTTDFEAGGILPANMSATLLALLLALYVFGIGKAAVMPLHFWLPAAMVAPTPVSALLHAVAVVKAGVFSIVKVAVYVFGLDRVAESAGWLVYVAAGTLLAASLVALRKNDLKARLAYSTVSQLAYVVLGALLATSTSVVGAGMQMATHAAGKITLFFCAGAIYVAAHKTEVSQLDGIGRTMPVTMLAFLVASLSIIGMPPLGGSWSKWFLALGALDAGWPYLVGVLMLSSLLNVAYLMSIVARAFFKPPEVGAGSGAVGIKEAPLPCLIALCATALLCIALFFSADGVERLVAAALPSRQ
jgi:multicomponent Na+:H+ antiporter subunit D